MAKSMPPRSPFITAEAYTINNLAPEGFVHGTGYGSGVDGEDDGRDGVDRADDLAGARRGGDRVGRLRHLVQC